MPGWRMSKPKWDSDERYGTWPMVRRLLAEHAYVHRRLYVFAFLLMGVSAGATAVSTYLLGDIINQAYVHRNFQGIVAVGLVAIAVFVVRGIATYGHAVLLSRVANKVVAANQRALFDKLLKENLSFFADRHSSEFIARLTTGANPASQALNLLITAIGPDLSPLI